MYNVGELGDIVLTSGLCWRPMHGSLSLSLSLSLSVSVYMCVCIHVANEAPNSRP